MNQDRLEGTLKTGVGQVQEGLGSITGDNRQEAQGLRRQVAGRAQQMYGDAKDTMRNATDQVSRNVSEHPVRSLLIAGAVGWAAALISGKRRRRRDYEERHY